MEECFNYEMCFSNKSQGMWKVLIPTKTFITNVTNLFWKVLYFEFTIDISILELKTSLYYRLSIEMHFRFRVNEMQTIYWLVEKFIELLKNDCIENLLHTCQSRHYIPNLLKLLFLCKKFYSAKAWDLTKMFSFKG